MKNTFKIATPVSHFFNKEKIKTKIIALSDILELRDNNVEIENDYTFIYHSELNILAKWTALEKRELEKINKKYTVLFSSYHVASRYQMNKIVNGAFIGLGKPLNISEMNRNIRDNIKIVGNIFGKDVPILIENNNYLLTDAYDIITGVNFLSEIIRNNGLYLLLDISHAKVTVFNKNLRFTDYINNLPLKKCMQIHLSRHTIKNNRALDSHEEMQAEDWLIFKEILNLLDSKKYITIEYYKDCEKLIQQLKILKKIQNEY